MITYKEYIKEGIGIEMFIHDLLSPFGKVTTKIKNHHYIVDFHEVHCEDKNELLNKLNERFKIKILDKCKVDLQVK